MAIVYMKGIRPVSPDGAKALEYWETALPMTPDERKADVYMSMSLYPYSLNWNYIYMFIYRFIHRINTISLAMDCFIIGMADVYKNGIHPVPLDGAKTLEYCELALLYPEAKRHSIYWCTFLCDICIYIPSLAFIFVRCYVVSIIFYVAVNLSTYTHGHTVSSCHVISLLLFHL